MVKEIKISLLPAVLVIIASLSSMYIVARVMLVQQSLVLQGSRENLAGNNVYKDLQKIKQLSYELNGLAEQFISTIETGSSEYKLKQLIVLVRNKGNELYFQTGYPFGKNVLGLVQAAEAYMQLQSNDAEDGKKLLTELKNSRNRFFTEYSKELAEYQRHAMPEKITYDIGIMQLMKFIGN